MADAEAVRFALRDILKSSEFNAAIDAVYSEKNDGLEPIYPIDIWTTEKVNPTVFPCAEIVTTLSRNLAPESELIRLQHEVHIFWIDNGSDEEELETRLGRLLRATRDYFRNNPLLPGISVEPVILGDDNYSPFVQSDLFAARPLVKAGLIVLYVATMR